jgi:hypothetical protein
MKKKSASKRVKSTKLKRTSKARGAKQTAGKRNRKIGVPRSPQNPFRLGSAYGAVFDILASHPDGISRQDLLKLTAKATGKDATHAGFDMAVVLSARDSLNGERHRSCASGFYVCRENDHLSLKTS